MTTYKEIFGKPVKVVDTDPTSAEAEGQVWYNSTSGTFKTVLNVGGWSAGGNLAVAVRGNRSAGTQNAALTAFGNTAAPAFVNTSYEYDGSSWASNIAANTGRAYLSGFGIQTAAVYAGGYSGPVYNNTEEYNGSSWTNVNAIGTARFYVGGAGTETAGLIYLGTPPDTGKTEEYNGTTWSEVNDNPTPRRFGNGFGTQTAALAAGGLPNSAVSSQEYDGTNWTSGGNLNTGRGYTQGCGTLTAGLVMGGNQGSPSSSTAAELYDGTTFTTTTNMATGQNDGGGNGTQTAGLYSGGGPTHSNVTQEFGFSIYSPIAATWSSGGSLNTARQRAASAGNSQTSAMSFGGFEAPPNGPPLNNSETYNGTSWSEGNNLTTARGNTSGFGTETAAVCGAGRGTPSGPFIQNTEEYDGSSWTAGNTSSTAAAIRSTSGTLTAGLMCGGFTPSGPAEHVNNVEEYDGSSWTSVTVLPQYQAYNCQCGTQTATLNGGGNAGPNAPTVNTNAISLDYDGTNWTAGPNANIAPDKYTAYNGGTGTQTSALFLGGDGTTTARFDGTTFSLDASIPASRGETNSAGSAPSNSALVYAGFPVPSIGNTTLEYTASSDPLDYKTLTSS